MRVRRLDKNGDFSWGGNKNTYIDDNNAVLQNVSTRLKSFKYDWFLDADANIDWLTLLSQKNNEQSIKNEIERIVKNTYGVTGIISIDLEIDNTRNATINLVLSTVFQDENKIGVTIW